MLWMLLSTGNDVMSFFSFLLIFLILFEILHLHSYYIVLYVHKHLVQYVKAEQCLKQEQT